MIKRAEDLQQVEVHELRGGEGALLKTIWAMPRKLSVMFRFLLPSIFLPVPPLATTLTTPTWSITTFSLVS